MKQLLGHYDSTCGDFTGILEEVTAEALQLESVQLIWMYYFKRKFCEPTELVDSDVTVQNTLLYYME